MYCGNSKPTQTYTNSNVGSIHRGQPVSATCSVCALHRLHVHLLPNGVLHKLQMDLGSTTSYMGC